MSPWLLNFLSDFSNFVHGIAIGVTGVACLRLSKRGASRAFGAAAWLALAGFFLLYLPWLLSWVLSYLSISPSWWLYMNHLTNLAVTLLFGHYLLFAVAAFHTAQRLPARARTERVTPVQQLPAE